MCIPVSQHDNAWLMRISASKILPHCIAQGPEILAEENDLFLRGKEAGMFGKWRWFQGQSAYCTESWRTELRLAELVCGKALRWESLFQLCNRDRRQIGSLEVQGTACLVDAAENNKSLCFNQGKVSTDTWGCPRTSTYTYTHAHILIHTHESYTYTCTYTYIYKGEIILCSCL